MAAALRRLRDALELQQFIQDAEDVSIFDSHLSRYVTLGPKSLKIEFDLSVFFHYYKLHNSDYNLCPHNAHLHKETFRFLCLKKERVEELF